MRLALVVLTLSACTVVDPSTLAKACNAEHPCANGFGCDCGVCLPCGAGTRCEKCAQNAGLRWWWSLDSAANGAARDCSGNERPGVSAGTVSSVTGAFGQGWSVAAGGELIAPEGALEAGPRTLTFHALASGAPQSLYEERSGMQGLRLTATTSGGEGAIALMVDEGGGASERASVRIQSGRFDFIALSRDELGALTLRVNDDVRAAGPYPLGGAVSAAFHPTSAREPARDAVIDEVRVYDRALGPNELSALQTGACSTSLMTW